MYSILNLRRACCAALFFAAAVGCDRAAPPNPKNAGASTAKNVEKIEVKKDDPATVPAQTPVDDPPSTTADGPADDAAANDPPPKEEPVVFTVDESALHVEKEGLTRLHPDYNVWVDKKQKRVVLSCEVVRQQGQLELFLCLKQMKEHEAVVSVHSQAMIIHAALLAIGADPGSVAQFQDGFKPPTGTEIEVDLLWKNDQGEQKKARGQDWVRTVATGKAMEGKWVFAGSGFWTNPANGEKRYLAEDGDVICVSNFNSALMDVAMESTATDSELLFDAFTENIPPRGTRVTVLLTPKLTPKPDEGEKKAE